MEDFINKEKYNQKMDEYERLQKEYEGDTKKLSKLKIPDLEMTEKQEKAYLNAYRKYKNLTKATVEVVLDVKLVDKEGTHNYITNQMLNDLHSELWYIIDQHCAQMGIFAEKKKYIKNSKVKIISIFYEQDPIKRLIYSYSCNPTGYLGIDLFHKYKIYIKLHSVKIIN